MKLTSSYRNLGASLPTSRNFMLRVDVGTMPYALRTAFDLLGLTPIKDKLSIDQVVAAFQNHEQTLEDQLGRTADDLIRDLNQFLTDQEHVRVSRRASQGDWVVPLEWEYASLPFAYVKRPGMEMLLAFFHEELPSSGNAILVRDTHNFFGLGPGHDFLVGYLDDDTFYIEPDVGNQPSPHWSNPEDFKPDMIKNLPRQVDLSPFIERAHEQLGQDTRPDEYMPEDLYMASRTANLDDWVIKCKWHEALFGLECDLTPDQAQAIYYINSKLEIWTGMNVRLDHFCEKAKIPPKLNLIGSTEGYKLRWTDETGAIRPPRRINLARFLPKDFGNTEHEDRPDQYMPEDFYTL